MVVKSEYPGNERRVSTGLEAGRGCRNAAARRLRDGGGHGELTEEQIGLLMMGGEVG